MTNAAPASQKYAFLDRDGTLIYEPQDTYQIDSLEKLRVLDGVIPGLQTLLREGYRLVMVSNQDGLGTPSFPEEDFLLPHNKMLAIFKEHGIAFEAILICPHLPEDNCNCRKPKTQLLDVFMADHQVDMHRSFVAGDRDTDRQLAANLGLRYVSMPTNGSFTEVVTGV